HLSVKYDVAKRVTAGLTKSFPLAIYLLTTNTLGVEPSSLLLRRRFWWWFVAPVTILVGFSCSDDNCFGGGSLLRRHLVVLVCSAVLVVLAIEWALVFGALYCPLQVFSGGGCWPVDVGFGEFLFWRGCSCLLAATLLLFCCGSRMFSLCQNLFLRNEFFSSLLRSPHNQIANVDSFPRPVVSGGLHRADCLGGL
ncbi:hypothetical protein A2U01_0005532, partial [Trifolium medium]|nr:hypothetical protein [Trifolium medium]